MAAPGATDCLSMIRMVPLLFSRSVIVCVMLSRLTTRTSVTTRLVRGAGAATAVTGVVPFVGAALLAETKAPDPWSV
jgi:hypothetical protein